MGVCASSFLIVFLLAMKWGGGITMLSLILQGY
jgi:hypothetical protein